MLAQILFSIVYRKQFRMHATKRNKNQRTKANFFLNTLSLLIVTNLKKKQKKKTQERNLKQTKECFFEFSIKHLNLE